MSLNEQQIADIVELAQLCERRLIDVRHNPDSRTAIYSGVIAREASAEAFRIAQEAR